MNPNPRNDQNMSDQNVQGLRKLTYWEKYGVQCFPYPGRRRNTPLVYQCEDGGIIISNDVFRLTIRQFEEMNKACLVRRKAQEQYILNLRYPDKTSDEYLEYLENRTDCNKGSDRDIMCVMKNVDVIQNIKNIKHPIHHTTLLMETDNDHPGFIRLRLIAGGDGETNFITCESFESSKKG
ncbi:unnamed protein product [Mytilus coruscus]|uniref:Uncharacterized protein n=1 Tax=Mytilus coruscus TaxID=42192 RepID=A0A6J8BL51_MYTCO|nr:unnamed protein product [Mytilus coruscus]